MTIRTACRLAGWLTLTLAFLSGCGQNPTADSSLDGKALATLTCAQCHTVPAPDYLTREEWPYLLSWMGHYLGQPGKTEIHPALVASNFVPARPVVTREQFEAIQTYYLANSPGQSQLPPPLPAPPTSALFQSVVFPLHDAVISLVAFDPPNQALVVGLSSPPGLLILERGVTTPIQVPSEPVAFERLGQVCRLALIGHLRGDARQGQVVDFSMHDGTRRLVVDAHPRISAHRTADLDGDGHDDLLVCGFGDYPVGRVGVWWGSEGTLTEQVLLEEPGTTWGDVADLDGDGDADIILALGNNHPRLFAFVNEGRRQFTPRNIIERPIGWGYNRCLVTDWNGDGKPDLVETAGNNLELRGRPIKANHGVRVLQNAGDWKFQEVLVEPLAGAMDVAAADFDSNGHLDLAVTAFYPDWRLEVPTTFLLLMQQPDGRVERTGIAGEHWNRWMRLATGDADGDGDTDILLGAASVPLAVPSEHAARYQKQLQGKANLLLLRNLTKP